jgi:hypothetical protein
VKKKKEYRLRVVETDQNENTARWLTADRFFTLASAREHARELLLQLRARQPKFSYMIQVLDGRQVVDEVF